MTKSQIPDLLDELQSSETFARNAAVKKIIKDKINDEQIVATLKDVIENDSSMSVRNFARAALDVFGVEHSAMEEPRAEVNLGKFIGTVEDTKRIGESERKRLSVTHIGDIGVQIKKENQTEEKINNAAIASVLLGSIGLLLVFIVVGDRFNNVYLCLSTPLTFLIGLITGFLSILDENNVKSRRYSIFGIGVSVIGCIIYVLMIMTNIQQ